MRTRVSKAFTLVEILIVVVILGILAAIVIPQFTNASEDAQVGNVQTQLQTIRGQIELFRVRNNGQLPVLDGAHPQGEWGDFLVGEGAPAPFNVATNSYGAEQEPYMRTAPINPRTQSSTIALVNGNADPVQIALVQVAIGDDGWILNTDTGAFAANGFDEAGAEWFQP